MADWQVEIESRLLRSKIYNQFKSKAKEEGDAIDGQVTTIVFDGVKYAYEKSKLIIKYMPEYTLHDGEHLFRVLYLMEKLIPDENLKKLSVPELMLLILIAFFHDIGMSPYENEIRSWKRDWLKSEPNEEESTLFSEFERFKNTYPDKIEEITGLKEKKEDAKAQLIEDFLISEYIRTTHAKRAREIIAKDWKGKIKYQETDLTNELAQLCFSHNEDAMSLLNMDSALLCGENVMVCLPFLGVILRLADLLDFDSKRTPSVLFSHLAVRNPVSLIEWQKHRAMQSWRITNDDITFSVKCGHPAIEASIRKFCDYIDDELKNCSLILSRLFSDSPQNDFIKYKIQLPLKVTRDKIGPITDIATGEPIYYYKNTSFELNKNQVIDLLMGTKLYGKPEVALRELIQNSRDACLLSAALHKKWGQPYEPSITVKYYSKDKEEYLEVIDNGIGMNQEIIDKFYSKIGVSYYKSRDFFDLRAKSNLDFDPISEFGIGILSCFMVADTIEVETKRLKEQYEYDNPLKIIIEGHDSIFTILKSDKKTPGTSTKLLLRDRNPWKKMTKQQFIDAVKNVIPYPPFAIVIETDNTDSIPFTKKDFQNLKAESLKDYSWNTDENIKEFKIEFNELGFYGNALIAILEKNNSPIKKIDKLSKDVKVDDEVFKLSMEITLSKNEINKRTTTINIDDDGNIKSSNQETFLARSKSSFSLHGIKYSGSLFPDYYTYERKTALRWPFPILLILDIEGKNGLDLNSARNEIIYNEKWNDFEQNLAYIVCKGLYDSMQYDYWQKLEELLKEDLKLENFLSGLNRFTKTLLKTEK